MQWAAQVVRHDREHLIARTRRCPRELGLGPADPDRELDTQTQPARRKIVLRDEVRDAGVDGGLQEILALLTGDEHDRRVTTRLANLLRDLDAGAARQILIEQDAV